VWSYTFTLNTSSWRGEQRHKGNLNSKQSFEWCNPWKSCGLYLQITSMSVQLKLKWRDGAWPDRPAVNYRWFLLLHFMVQTSLFHLHILIPSFPRSASVSASFWFILHDLFANCHFSSYLNGLSNYVCVHLFYFVFILFSHLSWYALLCHLGDKWNETGLPPLI
jgi:hypothetical protein